MSYNFCFTQLKMYKNIHFICKSIELVTILKLNMLQKKILYSRKLTKILFCYLKDLFYMHYLDCKNTIVTFFTDKSCSGIINNALWSNVKKILTSLYLKKNILLILMFILNMYFIIKKYIVLSMMVLNLINYNLTIQKILKKFLMDLLFIQNLKLFLVTLKERIKVD